MALKSYQVFTTNGNPCFVLIASDKYSLKELNALIKNGMHAVVVDVRSGLVDKNYVDTD